MYLIRTEHHLAVSVITHGHAMTGVTTGLPGPQTHGIDLYVWGYPLVSIDRHGTP